MKFMKFLMLGLLFVSLAACGGNDDEDALTPDEQALIGTWKATALSYNGLDQESQGGVVLTTTTTVATGSEFNISTTFTSDKKFVSPAGSYKLTGTSTNDQVPISIPYVYNVPSQMVEGTWTRSGNVLTSQVGTSTPVVGNIVSITGSTLVTSNSVNSVQTIGLSVISRNIDITITYTKQ